MDKYFITRHAIDRLIERCPQACKIWPQLTSWNGHQSPASFKRAFDDILSKSSENKSIINNTGFMASTYWNKYGFDSDFKFFESQEHRIKFIFVKSRNENDFRLVTVTPFEGLQKVNKWAKTKTKESKEQEKILSAYEKQGSFLMLGEAAIEISQHVIPVDFHIKAKLFKMARENKSTFLHKKTNSILCHEYLYENKKYEFTYYKHKDAQAIEVTAIIPQLEQTIKPKMF